MLAACTNREVSSSDGAPSTLVLTGSSTVAPLALEIGKRFESLNPGIRIDVQTGGSSRGISDLRQDLNNIGMVARALTPDESELVPHTIALDGIGIIVHRDNPVPALSDEQVVAIYRGQIRDWHELGGPAFPITVVHKAEGRSTLELFLHHFRLRRDEVAAQVVIGDNEQGIKTVAGNPGAIGYVSIGTATYDAAKGVSIRLLSMNGVAATLANLRSGAYPLARQLNLVTGDQPTDLAQRFIDFAQSGAVQDLVSQQYFVSPSAH